MLLLLFAACAPSDVYFEPDPIELRNIGNGQPLVTTAYLRNDSDADVYVSLELSEEVDGGIVRAGLYKPVPAGTMADIGLSAAASGDGTEHFTLHVEADIWWCSDPCVPIGDPDDKVPLTIDFDMRKSAHEE